MPIHFYIWKQFYFKQFSLALVNSLIFKVISISSYSVLIQTIQFSISLVFFVYTQLNLKTVLFQTIQFCILKKFYFQLFRNTKNTYDFLVQVRNFLLPLSLKVFLHKERGTIFLCWLFHLTPPTHTHVWHPPQGHCELAKVTLLLRTARISSLTFFKILRARFRCMTSFTSPSHNFLSGIFILTSVNDTSSPRVR